MYLVIFNMLLDVADVSDHVKQPQELALLKNKAQITAGTVP